MSIPMLDQSGNLPPGIHYASWKEIMTRYGVSTHRLFLLGGLKRAIAALRVANCCTLYLDGSFVTTKSFPADYDACWEAKAVDFASLDPVFMDFSNRRAAQKSKFSGEFFPVFAATPQSSPYRAFLDFFQKDKDTGIVKGILAINLLTQK